MSGLLPRTQNEIDYYTINATNGNFEIMNADFAYFQNLTLSDITLNNIITNNVKSLTDLNFYTNNVKRLTIPTAGLTTNNTSTVIAINGTDLCLRDNIVTLTGTQELTNKTLTSPVITTITNTGTLTLPTSTDTLVGRATTDTLTNKTIDKVYFRNTDMIDANADMYVSYLSQKRKKISLYDIFGDEYRFGGLSYFGDTMRYHVPEITNSHVFYTGTSPSTESPLFTISGGGIITCHTVPTTNNANLDYLTRNSSTGVIEKSNYINQDVRTTGTPTFASTTIVNASTTTADVVMSTNVKNNKLVIQGNANASHQFNGFGINSSVLRYQTDATTVDHVFYSATSVSTSQEVFRIKGTGSIVLVVTPSNINSDQTLCRNASTGVIQYQTRDAITNGVSIKPSNIVFVAGTQADFRIDTASPTDGWIDIPGPVSVKGSGVNNPSWSLFRNGIYAYEFDASAMHECWSEIHIPHDYAVGTGIYFHVHWAPNAAAPTGNVKWNFEYTYASSDGVYGATNTVSIVTAMPAQYTHKISEIASPVLAGNLEVDGVILVRLYRDPADVQDTSADAAFLFYVDCHINVNKFSTKFRNKASGSFYV